MWLSSIILVGTIYTLIPSTYSQGMHFLLPLIYIHTYIEWRTWLTVSDYALVIELRYYLYAFLVRNNEYFDVQRNTPRTQNASFDFTDVTINTAEGVNMLTTNIIKSLSDIVSVKEISRFSRYQNAIYDLSNFHNRERC